MKYSKALVTKICEELATGNHTIEDTCTKLGISKTQFYVWKQKKPDFAEALKEAERKRLETFKAMALSGLAKLLNEHEYEEVVTEYENDAKGQPKIKTMKRTKKRIMPNPTAVIFTLTNRDPQDWKHQNNIDVKTDGESLNKGFYDVVKAIKSKKLEE